MRHSVRRLLAALLVVCAHGVDRDARAADARAQGGADLLEALERSPIVVVGEVSAPRRVDLHGYSAQLRVERVLAGSTPVGSTTTIAWEELAPARAPRFADADRVLLALERLPGASLWSQRFPEPGSRSRVFAVAAESGAFLRRPTPASIDLLDHYLRLDAADRVGASGVGYLAQLLAGAEPELSLAAAVRLAAVAALDDELGPASADALVRSLLRPDADERLRAQVLGLIEAQQLESLRGPLEALAALEPLADPVVFAALGRLSGALPAELTRRLLRGGARHRAVAARFAEGADAREQLSRLSLEDPDAAVRAQAVARLVSVEGVHATDRAIRSLYDADPAVRSAAARALATLGPDAVAPLRAVVDGGSIEAAQSAVAGLDASGAAAEPVLAEIAASHPDAGIRTLARLALGGSLDDHHAH